MNVSHLLQPIKGTRIASLLLDRPQFVQSISLIFNDILKKLNHGVNKILFWSAIGTLIMGSFYRYLRVVPGFRWVDNKNYLLLAPICVFLPYYLLKNKLLKMDGLFLLSAFTFSLTFLITGSLTTLHEQLILVAAYLTPIPAYFLFRYVRIPEKTIVNAILCFVIISFMLILIELIFTNFLGSRVFQLAFQNFLSDTKGLQIDRTVRNLPLFPGLGRVIGVWGNAGTPFATGGLFTAILFYGVALHRYRPSFKKKADIIIILSFISVYLCGSKTAYMVTIMMFGLFYFGFNLLSTGIMFVVGLGAMILYMLSMGGGWAGIMKEFVEGGILKSFTFFGNAFAQTDPQYWFYLLFGQGEESSLHPAEFQGEIDYLDQFIRVGLFNFILLIVILITYVQSVLTIKSAEIRRIHLPGLLFVLTLILGGMHYETIFKYPCNIIATALMGYTMNLLSRSHKSG